MEQLCRKFVKVRNFLLGFELKSVKFLTSALSSIPTHLDFMHIVHDYFLFLPFLSFLLFFVFYFFTGFISCESLIDLDLENDQEILTGSKLSTKVTIMNYLARHRRNPKNEMEEERHVKSRRRKNSFTLDEKLPRVPTLFNSSAGIARNEVSWNNKVVILQASPLGAHLAFTGR